MSDHITQSPVLEFYSGRGADAAGRTLSEIWSWNDGRLEMVHDFIQWLFPLPEPSRFNPDAPRLTAADSAAFRSRPALQDNVRRSLDRMLEFLGLARQDSRVVRGPRFAVAAARWLDPANHNHLRLTRILLFLGHAGLDTEAAGLLACLEDIAAQEGSGKIQPRTLAFWRAAVLGSGAQAGPK